MGEQETPSFYAILPADVRYDKRLTADEKILYCEITAMMRKTGTCWASNKYFADLFDVTKETISRRISHLYSLNYICVQVLKDAETNKIIERTITLPQTEYYQKSIGVLTEKSIPIDGKINRGIDGKIKENNTSNINNTRYNKESKKESKKEETFDDIINSLVSDEKLKETLIDFIKMRKTIKKPLTNRALKSIIGRVKELSKDNTSLAIEIIDRSIRNGWQDVYPLTNQNKNTKNNTMITRDYTNNQLYNIYDSLDDVVI